MTSKSMDRLDRIKAQVLSPEHRRYWVNLAAYSKRDLKPGDILHALDVIEKHKDNIEEPPEPQPTWSKFDYEREYRKMVCELSDYMDVIRFLFTGLKRRFRKKWVKF